jgi:hypothetical protein
VSREHPGLVEHQRRASGQHVARQGWSVGALPLVQQLGDGVRRDRGVVLDRACRLRGRRDREHDTPVRVEIVGAAELVVRGAPPGFRTQNLRIQSPARGVRGTGAVR